jgi:5'-nucleotidase
MRLRHALAAVLGCALVGAPVAAAKDGHDHGRHHRGGTVDVQLVGINDFHGNLEPPTGLVNGAAAGGIEYLATHVKALEARNPRRTVVVSAGDLIGASPLLSALFHDEPTIEAMNKLGLDVNSVGNHEFDEGATELLRMQNGGCNPDEPADCGFAGADFRFLAANVVRESNGRTLFPPYVVKRFGGVKVAFIGETLEGTPQIVTPSGVAGLQFRDEADTINALVPRLRREGVRTIVALIHEGGVPVADGQCVSGPIRDIVERTSPEVDVFMTGHAHQVYNCIVGGRPVTSAGSFGKLLTDVDMTIDRGSGQPKTIRADNLVVTRGVAKDPDQTALIATYKAIAGPIGDRVIGTAAADITRAATPAGESALGDVIADSQLEATTPAGFGGAQIAFMNPGGIRTDIAAGPVTFAEAFAVQPFGNSLVTMTLTGAQIERVLEQQAWPSDTPDGSGRVLQVSDSLHYTWDPARPARDRIDPASITLGGLPLVPTNSYRVTVNSFLADGGDGFTVLREGTDRLGGAIDLDALEGYFKAHVPVAPGPRDRIARAGG